MIEGGYAVSDGLNCLVPRAPARGSNAPLRRSHGHACKILWLNCRSPRWRSGY